MAGIAGIFGSRGFDLVPTLDRMAKALCFAPSARVEKWKNAEAGLCAVRVRADKRPTQPVFSSDGSICVVMFGECFGLEAKRSALISQGFQLRKDACDIEYVMTLYEAYGKDAFSELSGSFCIALFDKNEKSMLLVSDRLGSRPIFYGMSRCEGLVFATQVAPVLCAPDIDRRINEAAVIEFCTLQRVVGSKTYHKGVRMLPPGSILSYTRGEITITPYWYPDYEPQAGSREEYAEELAMVMKGVLSQVHRDNERVAMLLSGGLDARMAVAADGERLTCFTFGDYENAEVQTARRIAEAGRCEFHFLERNPDHYPDMLTTAVEIGNGMHPFNHAHTLGFIDQISRDFDVVTHGFVPELLFRGYSLPKVPRKLGGICFGKKLDPDLNEEELPQRLYKRGYSLLGKGVDGVFSQELQETLHDTLETSAEELLKEANGHAKDVYDKFLWPDVYYHARYPSMLFQLSMRPFVLERGLVFYNEVIDLHLKLPVPLRADNRLWLRAMEMLNSDVAHTIDANSRRSPFFPLALEMALESTKDLIGRLPLVWRLNGTTDNSKTNHVPKGHSEISWPKFDRMIRANAKLRECVVQTLADPEALPPAIFDMSRVQRLIQDQLEQNGQHRVILFALLTFGLWHKRHMT